MNQEVKKEWVAALRSGDFKQGHYALYNAEHDMYCCLGVLCELHRRRFHSAEWVLNDPVQSDWLTCNTYLGHESHLPPAVNEWAGLEENGYLPGFLVTANDSDGLSFTKIAEYIEAYTESRTDDYYNREEE